MPRQQLPWLIEEDVQCFCGRWFTTTQGRGRHLRACTVWKTFSAEVKKEHRDRIRLLSVLRSHNPERGRWKFVMQELKGELGN